MTCFDTELVEKISTRFLLPKYPINLPSSEITFDAYSIFIGGRFCEKE